mgnify:CR=1 FL=1
MTTYIGIDPGKTGGVAAILPDGSLELHTIPLIGKEVDKQALSQIIGSYTKGPHIFVLEDVHAIPGTSAGTNFAFGNIKGMKEGLLIAHKAVHVLVAPKTWQKTLWMGIPVQKKAAGGNDTKATSLLSARRWFPTESFLSTSRSSVPHDGLVDAALMAKFAEITYGKK